MVNKINWSAIIAAALVCIVFLIIFQIRYDYQLGFRMGEIRGRSEAYRYISYRIGDKEADNYAKWLQNKDERSKP